VLEQIRLLTNLETSTKKLLQIVLVGQPELNELLAQPRLRQLSQRITARFHLTPLTCEETQRYINHRLSIAGMPEDRNPFSPSIVKQIHQFTDGIPRMINVLCERTLIGAYGHNKSLVDNKIFTQAKREVEGYRQTGSDSRVQHSYIIYGTLSATVIICVALIFFLAQLILYPQAKILTPIAELPAFPSQPSVPVEATNISADKNTPDKSPVDISIGTVPSFFDIQDNTKAQALLFEYLEFEINPDTHPCWQINTLGHQCNKAKFETWEEIIVFNRPMILSLVNHNKFKSNALLIGLQDNYALIIDTKKNRTIVDLEELGPLWTGEAFYAWKKPKNYVEPLSIGDTNDTIAEVAAQFALLDSQTRPLTARRFNRALQERVKIFQREHNLTPDGILGERTLMKINETLGLSITLEREFL